MLDFIDHLHFNRLLMRFLLANISLLLPLHNQIHMRLHQLLLPAHTQPARTQIQTVTQTALNCLRLHYNKVKSFLIQHHRMASIWVHHNCNNLASLCHKPLPHRPPFNRIHTQRLRLLCKAYQRSAQQSSHQHRLPITRHHQPANPISRHQHSVRITRETFLKYSKHL